MGWVLRYDSANSGRHFQGFVGLFRRIVNVEFFSFYVYPIEFLGFVIPKSTFAQLGFGVVFQHSFVFVCRYFTVNRYLFGFVFTVEKQQRQDCHCITYVFEGSHPGWLKLEKVKVKKLKWRATYKNHF